MRHLSIASIITGAAFLAACSSAQVPATSPTLVTLQSPITLTAAAPATPTDPLGKLAAFTLVDLKAASVDAHAQTPPDQTAFQCYDYLIAVIPTIQLPGGLPTVGAVLAFQRGRDLANGLNASQGALKSLNLACAPLVIDAQTTLNKLLAVGGGTVAGASVGLPLLPPL